MYKQNSICNCILNVLFSLFAGIGIAAVFFTGLLTSISILIYITLILGILGIISIIVSIVCNKNKNCDCIINANLIPSSVGAVITSIFALAVTTLPTLTIATAILIGIVAFFLVYLLISALTTIICVLCNNRCCKDNY